jgi:hypothetical protein
VSPSASKRRSRHPAATPAAGVRFAHPSERLFATLLDVHGIEWDYEPVEFALGWNARGVPVAGFRPDFWLAGFDTFVELTTADQRLVTRKNAKIRKLRELYPDVALVVVYQRDFVAILARNGLDPGIFGRAA